MDSATAAGITQTVVVPNLYFPPISNISILGVASDGITTYAYYGNDGTGVVTLGTSLPSLRCQE
jgi:hypothetical protein